MVDYFSMKVLGSAIVSAGMLCIQPSIAASVPENTVQCSLPAGVQLPPGSVGFQYYVAENIPSNSQSVKDPLTSRPIVPDCVFHIPVASDPHDTAPLVIQLNKSLPTLDAQYPAYKNNQFHLVKPYTEQLGGSHTGKNIRAPWVGGTAPSSDLAQWNRTPASWTDTDLGTPWGGYMSIRFNNPVGMPIPPQCPAVLPLLKN
jgi:hypothetical protein